MGNTSKLALATYLCRDQINLQITEMNWPSLLDALFFDFKVTIEIDGKNYFGRGVNFNKEQALNAAIGEAFERSIDLTQVEFDSKTIGGIAVHTDIELARQAAICELIERDSFFCHFLTSTPFLSKLNFDESLIGQKILRISEKFGINVQCFQMSAPPPFFAAIVCFNGERSRNLRFGIRVGLGCSQHSIQHAMDKALLEGVPILAHLLLTSEVLTLDLEQFLLESSPNGNHHIRFAQHLQSSAILNNCLPKGNKLVPPVNLETNQIHCESLPHPKFWPQTFPLTIALAHHPSAVGTFWGNGINAKNHKKRLESFAGKSIDEKVLCNLVHPLG